MSVKCDENCAECRKYSSVHYNYPKVTYTCIVAGKIVEIEKSDDGKDRKKVW